MTKNVIEKLNIKKVNKENVLELKDQVIKETPLTIFVNGYELVTLMTIPKELKELAIGFLSSEGIIDNINEIDDIKFSHNETIIQFILNKEIDINLFKKRTLTSGCGKGVTFSNLKDCAKSKITTENLKINYKKIINFMTEMQNKSNLFNKTGGTHTAVLADLNDILLIKEDIGRHNTIDKVIGSSLINNINLKNKVILTSGRISSEIIIKILKQSIPIIISRSAPTTAAVEIGKEKNITVIGFTRGNRFNIYNDCNRIII